jgi:hypothetical protein
MELDEPRLFPPALNLDFERDRLIRQVFDIRFRLKESGRIGVAQERPRFTTS